jgi:ATP-binding cassette subfamily C (CFTR/MRP) protein 4
MSSADFNSGEVGLAITQIMWVISMVEWGMRRTAEMSNQMMSVERVLEYKQITSEETTNNRFTLNLKEKEKDKMSIIMSPIGKLKDWPTNGTIVFKKVFLSYTENKTPILKNLNFYIDAMEKVHIRITHTCYEKY